MAYVYKPVGGAVLGVSIPLVIEYGAKGKRIDEEKAPVKWSGVAGIVEGAAGIGTAVVSEQGWALRDLKDEDKAFLAAFGGAGLATGLSIIVLDELRKRALYEFRKTGKAPRSLPLTEAGYPRMEEETPTVELVEEI